MSAIPRKPGKFSPPSTPAKWRPESVVEIMSWSSEELAALTADIAAVFERVYRDMDAGVRGGVWDTGGSSKNPDGGASNGSVPRIAISRLDRADPIESVFRGLLTNVAEIRRLTANMRVYSTMLMGLDFEKARALAEQSAPQRGCACANCKRWVENTPNDPIRSGRCGACWQWRRRHDGEERPKDQWEESAA